MAGLALAPATAQLGAALPAAAQADHRKISLAIGVNAYRHLDRLQRATNDAAAIQARLTSFGYAGRPCLDPDRAAFETAINDFIGALRPDTSALLFYAGHGFQAGGSNYLTSVETSANADSLYASSIELAALLKRIAERRPRQAVVVLDACREFPWQSGDAEQRKGFASILAPGGFYIAYSAGSGELALDDLGEGDTSPNSVFTRALLTQLRADASIDAAMKSARAEVTCLAASVQHPQHPAIYDQTTEMLTLGGAAAPAMVFTPGAGALPRTLVLVIAQEGEGPSRLKAPPQDLKMVATAFRGLGAEVRTALNPDRAQVERLLDDAGAAQGLDQVVLYWTGDGCYSETRDGPEAMFIVRVREQRPQDQAVQAVTLAEVVRRLKHDQRRTIVLADMCLQSQPATLFAEPGPGERGALGVLMRGGASEKSSMLGQCAAIFATGFGALSMDAYDGKAHSPFAGAIANALGRPGLTLRDFATVIRNEVDEMTDSQQIPAMFGVTDVIRRPFVQPRGCVQAPEVG